MKPVEKRWTKCSFYDQPRTVEDYHEERQMWTNEKNYQFVDETMEGFSCIGELPPTMYGKYPIGHRIWLSKKQPDSVFIQIVNHGFDSRFFLELPYSSTMKTVNQAMKSYRVPNEVPYLNCANVVEVMTEKFRRDATYEPPKPGSHKLQLSYLGILDDFSLLESGLIMNPAFEMMFLKQGSSKASSAQYPLYSAIKTKYSKTLFEFYLLTHVTVDKSSCPLLMVCYYDGDEPPLDAQYVINEYEKKDFPDYLASIEEEARIEEPLFQLVLEVLMVAQMWETIDQMLTEMNPKNEGLKKYCAHVRRNFGRSWGEFDNP